jgi:eukaryotic-like serine/threonine-protein kinase
MQLWTEYEGVTVDGVFPLKKLLLPEGRSAFFSTANGRGEPTVMRLVECHFDEEEILTRWRSVDALGHPNFLKIERFGQLALDDRPVVYAVFERVDANLAEVVARSRLTGPEAAQLASTLASALETLHTHGFVHEHVELHNVFTVGDVVKLRSDCIREAPEGDAGLAAKRRDVQNLAMLLAKALTPNGNPDAAGELSSPFNEMVRNGLSGTWGLAEIKAAAQGWQASSRSSNGRRSSSASTPVYQPVHPSVPAPPPSASSRPEPPELRPTIVAGRAFRQEYPARDLKTGLSLRNQWIGVAALAVIIVLTAGWLLAHLHGHHAGAVASPSVLSAKAIAAERSTTDPDSSDVPAAGAIPEQRAGQSPAATPAQWRVVAYTYNSRADAQKMSAAIDGKHPGLRPEVFSPNGHAPYLVTVGGVMTKREALAWVRRLRRSGLPRDTYAQNYSAAR